MHFVLQHYFTIVDHIIGIENSSKAASRTVKSYKRWVFRLHFVFYFAKVSEWLKIIGSIQFLILTKMPNPPYCCINNMRLDCGAFRDGAVGGWVVDLNSSSTHKLFPVWLTSDKNHCAAAELTRIAFIEKTHIAVRWRHNAVTNNIKFVCAINLNINFNNITKFYMPFEIKNSNT